MSVYKLAVSGRLKNKQMKTHINGSYTSSTWPGQIQLWCYSLCSLSLFLFSHGDKPVTIFCLESPLPVTVPLASKWQNPILNHLSKNILRRVVVAQRIQGLEGKTQTAHLWEGLGTQITSLHSRYKLPGQSNQPRPGFEPIEATQWVGGVRGGQDHMEWVVRK